MTWTLERKIAAGFGLGLAALVLVGVVQYQTIQTLKETDRLVAHTNAVLTELEGAFSAVQDVESRGRGYVLMGQQRFMGQIEESITDAMGHFRRLRALTADNPRQQRNLNRLEPLAEQKIAFTLRLIELRRTQGQKAASDLLDRGEGLRLMEQVRGIVDSMSAEENNLLTARRTASAEAARNTELVSLLGTVVAFVLILAAAMIVRRDFARRRQAETAVQHSEERYRGLVTATSQIVWTTSADGKVVTDLPSWRAYTGQSQQEIQGAGWAQALHPEDRDRTLEIWARAVATRSAYDTEYRLQGSDGAYRYFAVRGVPVMEPGGRIREWVGTCTDITEQRRAAEEIQELNRDLEQRVRQRTKDLEAANRELEAFSYTVSHDLRAPLRAIIGFARILTEEHAPSLDADVQHYIQVIRENAAQMGALIDGLLAFSRLGRHPLNSRDFHPGNLVREAMEEALAGQEGRQVEVIIGDLPACDADPLLLKQVFVNLLSNALKYTRGRNPARIEVAAVRFADLDPATRDHQPEGIVDPDSVVYLVRDNGIGFDMRYGDKLFGVFQRLHLPEEYEGAGVGLAIVQRIIHRHGGRVWAVAEPDRGATFYFTIGDEAQRAHPDASTPAKETRHA